MYHNLCFEQKEEKISAISNLIANYFNSLKNRHMQDQRTNGPVNAHLSLLHIPINMFEHYGI